MAFCSSIWRGLGVVLILSGICFSPGCSRRPPPQLHAGGQPPAGGGTLRILAGDPFSEDRLLPGLLARPLAEGGMLLAEPDPGRSVDGLFCQLYRFDPHLVYPDGHPVRPVDVLASWEEMLNAPLSPSAWLLEPVGDRQDPGHRFLIRSGPATTEDQLELCLSADQPDLSRRLLYPGLWFWRIAASTGLGEGPGPFVARSASDYQANPLYTGEPPYLQRIVRVAGDPLLLFNLGEIDVAVTYGREAEQLATASTRRVDMVRLPGQDRLYYLWLNPASRWMNDPTFRRWLAGKIDRSAMLAYLFAGRGQPLLSLLDGTVDVPLWEEVPRRPLALESIPRLDLVYEQTDSYAERIAARITAGFASEGVAFTPRARSSAELRSALREGSVNAALLVIGGSADDGVLTLLEAVAGLDASNDGVRLHLKQASMLPARRDRQAAAQAAEGVLLRGATLVPLLRLEAWLATDPELGGVEIGPHDLLLFQRAGWMR